MEVGGQLYALAAFLLKKEPSISIGRKDGWTPEHIWTLWRRYEYLLIPEIETDIELRVQTKFLY
jgi:hypothetical protein